MLIAVFGDIHGNLPAFEAALGHIDAAGIQTVLNTGDAIVGYPWPNEVIDLVRSRNIPSVQGEMDRFAVRFLRSAERLRERWTPQEFAALEWAHRETRSDHLEFLRALPKSITVTIDGTPIFLCHGTAGSQSEGLREIDDLGLFRRQREAANTRLFICGQTHRPYWRWVDDTLFVNPGSLGIPPDEGAFATYATVSTEAEPWTAEFVRVPYDMTRIEERFRECGLERP
ncbi:MAG: metallophosphoesterase family protein [Candidatus Hydrogenedentes bacterium]|nr:metallophosphoesterase family protein [Candidatus Hydrogenedentota bacterium]